MTGANGFELTGHSGEAVVMLHGFTGHPGHWGPMADFLSERGHTVIAPRLAGHGTSPADLATTTADDWLASARQAIDAVADHRHVHLVGLSLGGLLGILLAAPTAASSLTTINSPVFTRDYKVALAPVARYWVDSTPAAEAPPPDHGLAHLWTPYAIIPTRAVAELVRVVRWSYAAAGRLRRPSLVIQSRTDETVRPGSGPILARRLGGRLMWLEEARHNAILDPARTLIHQAVADHVEGISH